MHPDHTSVLVLEATQSGVDAIRRHLAAGPGNLVAHEVCKPQEFEAALQQGRFDLVLADPFQPGMDPSLLLDTIRRWQPGVPFIVISGSVGEERAADCLRRGADNFVHRDRLERLPAAMGQALERSITLRIDPRFREVARGLDDVLWVASADLRRVDYVSPAFEGVWDCPPESIAAWPPAVEADDAEAVAGARSRLSQGKPYLVEYRIRRPDGTLRWIQDRGFPLAASEASAAAAVGLACDVTGRRKLESELLQAQKMELVGNLAGGVAHDFNNLLTIISGYVSMLLDREGLQPAAVEALKRVFTASSQATGLVRQLLLFSRKRTLAREVVDLNTEVDRIVALVRRLLGETVDVEFTPSVLSPRVMVDVGMLEQVVMNLAVNARDAMPRGGRLTLGTGVRGREMAASGARRSLHDGDFASLSVRDTGTGIPPSILPRIFEPFFTTKDEGRGTGLGLATAQDIIKRHDGWIDVETAQGAGTVFTLYLPLSRAEIAVTQEPASRGGAKATILLVEDEANVREFAASVLQQDGYTLLQAKSAEAALEVWKWHAARIDLLLTDVVLPGEVSGPQLGRRLVGLKPGLQVILTTGYARESAEEDAGSAPAPVILNKPYTPRRLLQAVHEALALSP